jgi:hypothetical protein
MIEQLKGPGFEGLSRQRNNTTRPRAQQAKHSGEGAFFRLQCSTRRHEAETRAILFSIRRFISKLSALGNLAKPNRDALRNALLCSSIQ